MWIFRLTDFSSKSDEIQMEGQRFFIWDERNHPLMCLFSTHSLRDEAKTLPHSEDMSIHWESFSTHAKKKETVDGFGADPFQVANGFLNFIRIHLF